LQRSIDAVDDPTQLLKVYSAVTFGKKLFPAHLEFAGQHPSCTNGLGIVRLWTQRQHGDRLPSQIAASAL